MICGIRGVSGDWRHEPHTRFWTGCLAVPRVRFVGWEYGFFRAFRALLLGIVPWTSHHPITVSNFSNAPDVPGAGGDWLHQPEVSVPAPDE